MLEMYAPMVNSPITELADAIDAEQTTIEVVDGSKLPDAPNLAMIGLGEDTETILYTAKSGNVLSGVTRGFQGTAKGWPQGTRVARFFAAYDQMAIQENIKTLDQSLAAHLNDDVRHVTQIEKETWNNKVSKNGDVMNGSYYITSSYPIVLVNPAGGKLWVLHRSSTNVNALILAPRNNEDTGWDWDKQFTFHDSLRITIGSYLDGISIIAGTNSPEGNVAANPGSIYLRNNGTVYVKASGAGNTGWKAVQTS